MLFLRDLGGFFAFFCHNIHPSFFLPSLRNFFPSAFLNFLPPFQIRSSPSLFSLNYSCERPFHFFSCLLIESCFCFTILRLTAESTVSISATFVSWTNLFASATKVVRSQMSIINPLSSSEISSSSNKSLSSIKKFLLARLVSPCQKRLESS